MKSEEDSCEWWLIYATKLSEIHFLELKAIWLFHAGDIATVRKGNARAKAS